MATGTVSALKDEIAITKQEWRRRKKCHSIVGEISAGLTYVTIAMLAFDMGQTERGERALHQAREARIAAELLAEQLPEEEKLHLMTKINRLKSAITGIRSSQQKIAPSIRQPSMS